MTCWDKAVPYQQYCFLSERKGLCVYKQGMQVNENRRLERSEWVFCAVNLARGCFFGCGNIKHWPPTDGLWQWDKSLIYFSSATKLLCNMAEVLVKLHRPDTSSRQTASTSPPPHPALTCPCSKYHRAQTCYWAIPTALIRQLFEPGKKRRFVQRGRGRGGKIIFLFPLTNALSGKNSPSNSLLSLLTWDASHVLVV